MSEEIFSKLKNRSKGRPVLVISAGPSALQWKEVYDSIKDKNPFVACIKQAIELEGVADICDMHFINPYNLKKYHYKRKPFIIFSDALDAPKVFNNYDLRLVVNKSNKDTLENTLAYKLNFDDYTFDNSGTSRPWGPGIMHESVINTLLHMGTESIITVGWDIADSSGDNKHFYDNKTIIDNVDFIFRDLLTRLRAQLVYNWISYRLRRKYNYAGMMQGEAELTSESIPFLKKWLSSKGVELKIFSDSKWVN